MIILLLYNSCASSKIITSDSNIKPIIENKQLNILYRGIKNYLTIYVPKSDSIKVDGMGVQKESENNYSITPSLGSSLEITITSFFNRKKVIDKREFRILNIDKPFASIGNRIELISLSKEELANSVIKYVIPQFVINLEKIGKFRYQINGGASEINYGEEFSTIAKEKIYKMKSGDSIVIDDLRFNLEPPNTDLKKMTELKVLIK